MRQETAPLSSSPPSDAPGWQRHPGLARLQALLGRVYRGRDSVVDLLLVSYVAGGHALLEDIPGVGKTTLARTLAQAVRGSFRRLQCTPDLMPADITGVSIYDDRERRFVFHPGPVFCDILLADELNRTPPRTQSALLEAMNEGQVTVDGEARPLPPSFFCMATQNPLDHVGTYPLPDSQRDRFLLRFALGYPDTEREIELLAHDGAEADLAGVEPVIDLAGVQELRRLVREVVVADEVRRYILDLISATRSAKGLRSGASPRAGLGLQRAAQARALIEGRRFVIPDDVQALAEAALGHRVVADVGQDPTQIIRGLVESLETPR